MKLPVRGAKSQRVLDCAKRYMRRCMGLRDFETDQEANWTLRHLYYFGRTLEKRLSKHKGAKDAA